MDAGGDQKTAGDGEEPVVHGTGQPMSTKVLRTTTTTLTEEGHQEGEGEGTQ